MIVSWSREQLERIEEAGELEIASRRADGTLRRWLPIWVVCVERAVYVRSWHRRSTGWFGQVLDSGTARIRVPGLEADVVVHDIGDGSPGLRAAVDGAYRAKYSRYGAGAVEPMLADPAAATTLRLDAE